MITGYVQDMCMTHVYNDYINIRLTFPWQFESDLGPLFSLSCYRGLCQWTGECAQLSICARHVLIQRACVWQYSLPNSHYCTYAVVIKRMCIIICARHVLIQRAYVWQYSLPNSHYCTYAVVIKHMCIIDTYLFSSKICISDAQNQHR